MSSPMHALVEARDLHHSYDEGRVAALRGVSFQLERGEFVALMGPSGSGKSSLLQLLGALERPARGEIRYGGEPLGRVTDLATFRAQRVGFVFQSFHLLPTLSALENVQLPMIGQARSRVQRALKAQQLLADVGLAPRSRHLPSQLSGGERQRVAIARALANDPDLLLADEPTGNLDSQTAGRILDLLRELSRSRGLTVLLVTHDPEVAARADRILHLRDGRLVEPRTTR